MTDHDAQDATDTSDGSPMKSSQRRSSTTRRRSSLLQRARMSFYRSKGERGADVATLRGTRGADFEGEARVIRGTSDAVLCSCFGGGGNGEPKKKRFVLIKGSSCFVFASEESTSPKYAIKLAFMKAEVHGTTVELQTTLGDVEFRFAFDKAEIAERFAGVVTEQASIAEGDVAKKRLGHGHLLHKRASTKYADAIADKKEKDQPEAPITAAEVMNQVPMPGI